MPKADPQDILIVTNPDLNCDEVTYEVVKTNPQTGETISDEFSHKDYFQVRWSGYPHRLAPGQTRRMPRYLAEHFAKHLANHILLKMEKETGRQGLIQSPVERPKVLGKILVGIESYFMGEDIQTEGEKTATQVERMNLPEERPINLGLVPPPAVGVLKPEPPSLDQILEKAGEKPITEPPKTKTSIWDSTKPKPTRKELFADAVKLGIEVTGKESVDELIAKIKKF